MAFISLIGFVVIFFVSKIFYNIFFHPLRHYPGPWYTAGTRCWYSFRSLRRTLPYDIKRLHDKYGHVVRIAPDELSYTKPAAWQEIYERNIRDTGNVKSKVTLFQKDPAFYSTVLDNANSVFDSEGNVYRDQKTVLAAAFSRRMNISSQDILIEYAQRLVKTLKSSAPAQKSFNLVPWFDNVTLDIVVRLTTGVDISATEIGNSPHPNIKRIETALITGLIFAEFHRLLFFMIAPMKILLPNFTLTQGILSKMGIDFASSLIKQRLQNGNKRPDFISHMTPHFDTHGIHTNATLLFLAGSETTSTLLCSTIYFLLENTNTMELVCKEVRETYNKIGDVTIENSESLVYLKACITEALRLYPPIMGPFPRRVSKGGAIVCGNHVPENKIVSVCSWAMNHSEHNFHDVESFKPERWLGGQNDKIESKACHPFSFGPRICMARDLALAECRLILAHLLHVFDFELDTKSLNKGWKTPPTFMAPLRRPLLVKMKTRT